MPMAEKAVAPLIIACCAVFSVVCLGLASIEAHDSRGIRGFSKRLLAASRHAPSRQVVRVPRPSGSDGRRQRRHGCQLIGGAYQSQALWWPTALDATRCEHGGDRPCAHGTKLV